MSFPGAVPWWRATAWTHNLSITQSLLNYSLLIRRHCCIYLTNTSVQTFFREHFVCTCFEKQSKECNKYGNEQVMRNLMEINSARLWGLNECLSTYINLLLFIKSCEDLLNFVWLKKYKRTVIIREKRLHIIHILIMAKWVDCIFSDMMNITEYYINYYLWKIYATQRCSAGSTLNNKNKSFRSLKYLWQQGFYLKSIIFIRITFFFVCNMNLFRCTFMNSVKFRFLPTQGKLDSVTFIPRVLMRVWDEMWPWASDHRYVR